MNLRLLLLVLLLGLVAAATWWLAGHITPPGEGAAAPATHQPDYYFTDATVTTLDQQGHRAAQMSAPRIEHHPDDDSSEVFAPRLAYFAAGDPPWHGQADHALLPRGGRLLNLDGHVEMRRPAAGKGAPLVIRTATLSVNLDTNIGNTADPVSITQGSTRMTAVGMIAYFKDNRLVLQNNVRGHYVPQP
ncbi:MAG TPA: LPS export ABC transporter periplasmic protein LptC [Gammaproteobacteria bacterium]|nr:LPS export ABC transporter periplasmic protein LptC [Gammaproteobacteria bacterium]